MKRTLFIIVALGLVSCTFSGVYLEAPSSRNSEWAMMDDIQACITEASIARQLSISEKSLIEGRETSRFFKYGRPVITPSGNPALYQSLFPQPTIPAADLYAVCLLNRGYHWAEI